VFDLERTSSREGERPQTRTAGAAPAIVTPRDDAVGRVQFQPGTLLPAQWYGVPDAHLVPEKRLLLAVLEEAVATVQRYVLDEGRRARRLYREAEEWILCDDTSWPCTFRNVCDALGIDPMYLRRGVMRWSEHRRANSSDGYRYRNRFRRLCGSRTRTGARPVGAGRQSAS
jgi:hypothetical protein